MAGLFEVVGDAAGAAGVQQVARRLKGQADGHQVDDHLLAQAGAPALKQLPPGAIPRRCGQGRLALLEAQGLGLQGEGDFHLFTGRAARRKFLLQDHLLLAGLGEGDLDFP